MIILTYIKSIFILSIAVSLIAVILDEIKDLKIEDSRKKSFYEKHVKRFLDCFIALFFMLLFLIVFIVVAILVRVNLGSPILFSQDRPGRYGKIFKLYKFRTMTSKTDENGELLPDEMRLTSFGKLLRSTSLDEIPEFLNIIKGDMSFIGPRPLLVRYLPYYTDEEMHRHDVRPGLSGLAQINGRNGLFWEDRFKYDLEYVNNLRFSMDIRIIFETIGKVLKRSGVKSGSAQNVPDFDKYRIEQGAAKLRDEKDFYN